MDNNLNSFAQPTSGFKKPRSFLKITIIFTCVIIGLVLISWAVIFFRHINQSEVAVNTNAEIVSPVVAGMPIKWKMAVARNEPGKNQRFTALPKDAENIKLNKNAPEARVMEISNDDRKQLAGLSKQNFMTASVIDSAGYLLGSLKNFFQELTGKVIVEAENKFVDVSGNTVIEYETPGPKINQGNDTDKGKTVVVSAPNETGTEITNVMAYAKIPEKYNVGEEQKIRILWENNGNKRVPFHAYDLNGNGKIDYIEWTVPHLSTQTFDIIYISKAEQLDQDKNSIADIYEKVKSRDNIWASMNEGNYARITFEQILNKTKDITVYARNSNFQNPNSNASVEVYPVYTNTQGDKTEGEKLKLAPAGKIPDFSKIGKENTYKILLTNLQNPTDTFDLKVVGGGIDFDYVVDPVPLTVSDNFSDTTKIASNNGLTVDTSTKTVYLAASSAWTCGTNSLVDSRDGQTYPTVLIGSQCWMRTNLNVGTKISSCTNGYAGACATGGDTLQSQGTSCSSIKKYCYSDTEANCTANGGLYEWNQAMCGSTTAGAQGVCPSGWHVPTHDEYTTLERTICAANGGGTCSTDFPLDTTTSGWLGTHNEGTSLKTVNSSSFSGSIAGNRTTDGSFNYLSSYGTFWTSLQGGTSAWTRYLLSSTATIGRSINSKTNGFSLRCLKN